MATISRFRAVVSFKGLRLSGFRRWLMWLVVHVTFLTGFKNRFTSVRGASQRRRASPGDWLSPRGLGGSVPGRRPHCHGGDAIRSEPALAFTLDRVTLYGNRGSLITSFRTGPGGWSCHDLSYPPG